jgi:hypothetical protein
VVETPPEEELPTLEELGMGSVPFSPLGKGFLRDKIDENTTFDSSTFATSFPASRRRLGRQIAFWWIYFARSLLHSFSSFRGRAPNLSQRSPV